MKSTKKGKAKPRPCKFVCEPFGWRCELPEGHKEPHSCPNRKARMQYDRCQVFGCRKKARWLVSSVATQEVVMKLCSTHAPVFTKEADRDG